MQLIPRAGERRAENLLTCLISSTPFSTCRRGSTGTAQPGCLGIWPEVLALMMIWPGQVTYIPGHLGRSLTFWGPQFLHLHSGSRNTSPTCPKIVEGVARLRWDEAQEQLPPFADEGTGQLAPKLRLFLP